MPQISILIPVYNGVEHLAEALESVLSAEQGTDLELLVMDDGSTDGTWELLTQLAQRYQVLRVWRAENRGVAVARNYLLKHSRAEWVAFLDADDIWLPHTLTRFREFLGQALAADLWVGDFYVAKRGRRIRYRQLDYVAENPLQTEDLFRMYPMSTVRFYRRQFLLEHELDFVDFRNFEDVIFWYRLIVHKPRVYYQPEPWYVYQIREDSLSEVLSETKMRERIRSLSYLLEQVLPRFAVTCPALVVHTTERVLKTLELSLRGNFSYAERTVLFELSLEFMARYFAELERILGQINPTARLAWHSRNLGFFPRQVYRLVQFSLRLRSYSRQLAIVWLHLLGLLYRSGYWLIPVFGKYKPLK